MSPADHDHGPMLSVIVPATDRPPTLRRCREALAAGLERGDELIVVDGPSPAGPAAARNEGARRARGELLVFVDADVVVAADALPRIRAGFAADPELDALFGSYDDAPSDPGRVSRFRNLLHHHVHSAAAGPATTFWAGLGAVRREAFARAGGFDAERYPVPAVEDIELGMRLRERGATIRLDPAIRGTHLKRWTLGSMLAVDLRRRGIPWVELLVERGAPPEPGSARLNLAPANLLSAAAAVLLLGSALTRRSGPAAICCLALGLLNRRLYGLLLRSGGVGGLLAGVPLHLVHLLAAAAAVPPGLVAGLRRRWWGKG